MTAATAVPTVTIDDIEAAASRIAGIAVRPPLIR